jgi:hypothetical protein
VRISTNIGRFPQLLRRYFGIVGPLSMELEPTVIPSIELNDVQAPEQYRARGDNLWAQGVVSTSAAAQAARIQIGFDPATITPADRGKYITIVDEIRVMCSAAAPVSLVLDLNPNLNPTGTGVQVRYRDGRANSGTTPINAAGFTRLFSDQPAIGAPGTTLGLWAMSGPNIELVMKLGVVLIPFTRLDIAVNLASTTLSLFALGRERSLDSSEVT